MHIAWLQSIREVDLQSLIYRNDRERAASLQAAHGIPRTFDNLPDALRAGPLDLVSIVSPPESHAACVRTVVAAGVPVVLDKPLAQNLPDAEAIHALAEAQTAPVFVFFQWRLHPAAQKLRVLLERNAFGALTHVDATFDHDFLARNQTNWPWRHQDSTAGAGSLGDMGVHLFDLIRFVSGQEWAVTGALTGVAHPRRQTGGRLIDCTADDFAQVMLRATAGGQTASVRTSRVSLGRRAIALRVYGEAGVGAVTFDPETGTAVLTVQTYADSRTEEFESANPYEPIIASLRGQSRKGTMPARTADGLAAQRLMTAAVLAAQPANSPKQ